MIGDLKTFFICGTPRSRTAWLSNLLTTDNSYCFHELLGSVKNMGQIREEFLKTGRKIVGNSDSGNTLFIENIKKEFPQAKIVVIKRSREETIRSMMNFDIGIDYTQEKLEETIDLFLNGIERIEENYDCLSVGFSELINEECCKNIFEYCTGLPFDSKRWELLNHLNIQVDKKYAMEQIENLKENNEIFNLINI